MEYDCKSPVAVALDWSETIGVKKCQNSWGRLFVLGILAGVYVGFGAALATLVGHDATAHVGAGLAAFIKGAVFSVGLMLVVIGGAELFTGNNLIAISVLDRKVPLRGLLYNWSIVYAANMAGSILLAWLMFQSGLLVGPNEAVGVAAVKTAVVKVNLPFWPAFVRGILCNWIVCLAVWLALTSRNTIGKIWAIFFPIMAFVALSFEHSVANMYFIPVAIMVKKTVAAAATAAGIAPGLLANLNVKGFMLNNELPVTLGNIVGGAFFVGTLYWSAYLRKGKKS